MRQRFIADATQRHTGCVVAPAPSRRNVVADAAAVLLPYAIR